MARHPFRNMFLGRFIVCHKEIDIELDAVWIQESGQNIGKKDLEQGTEPFFRVALFVIDIKGIDVRSKAQDQVLQVVEFQHVKPGKGAAFVRTKTKNVITGSVVETSYNPTAKFPQAFIERREVTYSYEDGDLYYFMDNETYEQIPVAAADVPENFKFCKENEICKLLSYKGKVFSVEIPNFIELEVTETEPGFKGNTATNTLKPAKVETGAEIRVPLFINEGDKIRIDTRTGEYMERV